MDGPKILLQNIPDVRIDCIKMIRVVCFLFVLFATKIVAQDAAPSELKGKVNANILDLDGIYIVNIRTEKTTVTEEEGYFSVSAKVGDTLLFSAVQFKSRKIALTKEYFENGLLLVKLEPIMNKLKEVIIRRYDNINAVALGIIPKGQKTYTPAERKLKTATSIDATASAGTMAGGSVSADPLINLLSGRSAMLKKELEVEKKEFYMAMLEEMFDNDHFVNKLKIPLAYVKGFEYFAVENDKFTKILNVKNKTTVEFLLGELATKYNELIACEN